MLKELFSNRLFIGALAFFIFCVAGSLLYMHHENQKGAEYDAETQDRVAQWNAKQNQQSPAEAPVGDTSQGGHFHADGTWHGTPHPPPPPGEPLQKATQKQPRQPSITEKQFYASLGLEPPPEGFYYRVYTDNTPVLDENGEPRLFSYYEPSYNVFTRIGFAPTREQYERYQQLEHGLRFAQDQGDTTEVARLEAEIKRLKANAQGELPDFTSSVMAPTSLYNTAAYQAEIRRRDKEMRAHLYREWGLGHLPTY